MFHFANNVLRPALYLALTLVLLACSAASAPTQVGSATVVPSAQIAPSGAAPSSPLAVPPQPARSTATLPVVPQLPQTLAARVEAYLNPLVAAGQFSGAVLIARDGQVLVSQGFGMANLDHDVPNTPQTKFRIGSLTKQFTAMAILQLQHQGKLNVQDRICIYVPACPQAWQVVTIHQLLTHTSGIPNYTDFPGYAETMTLPASPGQLIGRIRHKPLLFQPGQRFDYSNSGYIVLGYIIEKVSGGPYGLFVKKHIFEPLQMMSTGYDNSNSVLKHRASGYAAPGVNANYFDMSNAYAAGGLYSTVEDLYRWDQALYTEQLVPQLVLDTMFTPFVSPGSPDEGSYGYGWGISKRLNRRWISHGGRIYGFSSGIDRYPDDKVCIIVLSNLENTDIGAITAEVAALLFGEQ